MYLVRDLTLNRRKTNQWFISGLWHVCYIPSSVSTGSGSIKPTDSRSNHWGRSLAYMVNWFIQSIVRKKQVSPHLGIGPNICQTISPYISANLPPVCDIFQTINLLSYWLETRSICSLHNLVIFFRHKSWQAFVFLMSGRCTFNTKC